jgi:hypothetical protein
LHPARHSSELPIRSERSRRECVRECIDVIG